MFFLGILSIQCKIWRDRQTDTRRSACWPPLLWSMSCADTCLRRPARFINPQTLWHIQLWQGCLNPRSAQ